VYKKVLTGLVGLWIVSLVSGLTSSAVRDGKVAFIPDYLWNKPSSGEIKQPGPSSGIMAQFRGLLIDARPNQFYRACHVPEAFNFPPIKFDFFYGLYFSGVSKTLPIFVYGRTYSHAFDKELAYQLLQKGHLNITVVPLVVPCS
jgi:hypothetical protein